MAQTLVGVLQCRALFGFAETEIEFKYSQGVLLYLCYPRYNLSVFLPIVLKVIAGLVLLKISFLERF